MKRNLCIAIANVLGQMGLVESWGTGIKRIMKAAEDYGQAKSRHSAIQ